MQEGQGQSLKPTFFLTRENGSMVPLVAADELPDSVRLSRVPRSLTSHDISGMTGIGTYPARHLKHTVETPVTMRPLTDQSLLSSKYATIPTLFHQSDDRHRGIRSETQPLRSTTHSRADNLPGAPTKAFGIDEQPPKTYSATTPMPISEEQSIPLPPWHDSHRENLPPAPGVKEYCSYWVRHGECDYAQQGCMYKHEMPPDLAGLQRIGLRDIPKWYREKHGLGSYLAKTNDKRQMMDSSWRGSSATRLDAGRDATRKSGESLLSADARQPANMGPAAASPTAAHRNSNPPEYMVKVHQPEQQVHRLPPNPFHALKTNATIAASSKNDSVPVTQKSDWSSALLKSREAKQQNKAMTQVQAPSALPNPRPTSSCSTRSSSTDISMAERSTPSPGKKTPPTPATSPGISSDEREASETPPDTRSLQQRLKRQQQRWAQEREEDMKLRHKLSQMKLYIDDEGDGFDLARLRLMQESEVERSGQAKLGAPASHATTANDAANGAVRTINGRHGAPQCQEKKTSIRPGTPRPGRGPKKVPKRMVSIRRRARRDSIGSVETQDPTEGAGPFIGSLGALESSDRGAGDKAGDARAASTRKPAIRARSQAPFGTTGSARCRYSSVQASSP